MPYAETDFFLALAKEDDWLQQRASRLLEEHEEVWTGLPTFIEIAYNAEEYEIELEQSAASILEIAETDVDDSVIFQAYAYIDDGLGVMDAFHAALAGPDPVISSDGAFEEVGLERLRLEPE